MGILSAGPDTWCATATNFDTSCMEMNPLQAGDVVIDADDTDLLTCEGRDAFFSLAGLGAVYTSAGGVGLPGGVLNKEPGHMEFKGVV